MNATRCVGTHVFAKTQKPPRRDRYSTTLRYAPVRWRNSLKGGSSTTGKGGPTTVIKRSIQISVECGFYALCYRVFPLRPCSRILEGGYLLRIPPAKPRAEKKRAATTALRRRARCSKGARPVGPSSIAASHVKLYLTATRLHTTCFTGVANPNENTIYRLV